MCTITSTTGEIVSVVAGIRGRLLELNESLSQNLNLITEKVHFMIELNVECNEGLYLYNSTQTG